MGVSEWRVSEWGVQKMTFRMGVSEWDSESGSEWGFMRCLRIGFKTGFRWDSRNSTIFKNSIVSWGFQRISGWLRGVRRGSNRFQGLNEFRESRDISLSPKNNVKTAYHLSK
jgi:hypothetical protein